MFLRLEGLVPFVLLLVLPVACGDDGAGGGGGESTTDAGGGDGGAADAAPDAAPAIVCDEPAVTATIGADGGELALCGARLIVRPGTLSEATEFTIEPAAAAPPAPGAPLAIAGPALRFSASRALPGYVEVALPHGGHQSSYTQFAVYDGQEMIAIEACRVDAGSILAAVRALGSFVALYDTYAYTNPVDGNGTGTASASIGGDSLSLQLPGTAYAIDQAYDDDAITMTLASDFLPGQLQLFALVVGNTATLLRAQWFADGQLWQADTGTITLASRDGNHLVGTATATLRHEQETMALSVELDVTPAYYQFPPERVCLGE